MINPEIHRFLSIGLVLLIFSAGMVWGTQAFADNPCDKNHDKKCNHSEKNQKSTSKSTFKDPVVMTNPTSGPAATLVNIIGNGFEPFSTVVISFEGDNRAILTSTSDGGFSATFNVPSTSSNGDHIVKVTQGSNSASKTFKVTDKAIQESNSSSKTFANTSSVAPTITLNSTSDPVGASINITGSGFDPRSTVAITFNDTDITTTPTTVKTTNNGEFFANFTVPLSSSVGFVQVVATQGSNSASETFIVTSSLAATTQPNVNATAAQSYPNLSEMMIPPDIFA